MRGKFNDLAHDQDFRSATPVFAAAGTTPAAGYTNNAPNAKWEAVNVSSCLVYCESSTPGEMCTILAKTLTNVY